MECDDCGLQKPAAVRVTACTHDGELLEQQNLCLDCALDREGFIRDAALVVNARAKTS